MISNILLAIVITQKIGSLLMLPGVYFILTDPGDYQVIFHFPGTYILSNDELQGCGKQDIQTNHMADYIWTKAPEQQWPLHSSIGFGIGHRLWFTCILQSFFFLVLQIAFKNASNANGIFNCFKGSIQQPKRRSASFCNGDNRKGQCHCQTWNPRSV